MSILKLVSTKTMATAEAHWGAQKQRKVFIIILAIICRGARGRACQNRRFSKLDLLLPWSFRNLQPIQHELTFLFCRFHVTLNEWMKYMCEKEHVLLNKLYIWHVIWKYILIPQSDSSVWFLSTYVITNFYCFHFKTVPRLSWRFSSQGTTSGF